MDGLLTARIDTDEESGWVATDMSRTTYGIDRPSPAMGRYTLDIGAAASSGSELPIGHGCASVRVGRDGHATVVGTLADGEPFSTAGVVIENQLVLFTSLYVKPLGSLSGALAIDGSSVGGDLFWAKPAPHRPDAFYPAGFEVSVSAGGSSYTPPGVLRRAMPTFEPGYVSLAFVGGNLPYNDAADAEELDTIARIDRRNAFHRASADILDMKIDTATGLISGHFKHPLDEASHVFRGVIMQNDGYATGWFRGTYLSGRVYLVPTEPGS